MAVQEQGPLPPPQGPHCVGDRRKHCHILAERGGAPTGSGRSLCGCQTTLEKDQDIVEIYILEEHGTFVVCEHPRFERLSHAMDTDANKENYNGKV